MLSKKVMLLLLALGLQGCADWSTQLPATTKVLDDLPRVENSTKSPCWQQRQVAKQNAYVDTIRGKKEVTYQAPCDLPKKIARG